MKHLSRLLALLLALAMTAAACGSDDASSGSDTDSDDTSSEEADESGDTEGDADESGDTDGEDDGAAAASGDGITIGLQLEPDTLDLTTSPAAAIPQALLYNVYETMVKLEADGTIVPLLAESWEVSDDAMTYTFTLRSGVTFHNGEDLTADDVVYSIDNVINKTPEHPFKESFAAIDSVEASDDTTVVITLAQPSANLLFSLAQGQGSVFDSEGAGDLANSANGTGPFSFVSWTVGDSIELVRNDAYWGEAAAISGATFRYIADENALTNAMLAGDLDLVANLSAPELLTAFEADDQFEVITGQTYGEVVLSLNGRNAPLDDIRVRQAITHAIDSQAVVDLAYAGYGTTIGTFSTPLDPWFDDMNDVYPYDPELAMELLAEAGVSDLTLRLVLPPTTYATRGGEIIQSQLAEVGITVEITNVEWSVWLDDVFANYDFDMSIVAHIEANDIASYGNPEYYWGDDSPAVADLVAAADAEGDPDARNALYGEAIAEVTAQAADTWLFVLPALSVARDGLTGYQAESPALSLDLSGLSAS